MTGEREPTHLEKAKAALNDAKDAEEGSVHRAKLLDIAQVQAMVAQAEALAGICDELDRFATNFREFTNYPITVTEAHRR